MKKKERTETNSNLDNEGHLKQASKMKVKAGSLKKGQKPKKGK